MRVQTIASLVLPLVLVSLQASSKAHVFYAQLVEEQRAYYALHNASLPASPAESSANATSPAGRFSLSSLRLLRRRADRSLLGIGSWKKQEKKKGKAHGARGAVTVKGNGASLFLDVTLGPFTGVVWRGWGTSLAWFANFVGGLPKAQLDVLLDALFDKDKGLGLNIARYVVPGGFNPEYSYNLTTRPLQAGGWGFRPWPNQGYNWSADANQRAVLVGAVQRGADIPEACVYSPPWWMTISKDSAGNTYGKQNLDESKFGAFVDFILTIVENFKTKYGVEFKGVDPFNEPLAGWWKQGGGQEGCGFSLDNVVKILKLTQAGIAKRRMRNTALVGIDDWATQTLRAIKAKPELPGLLERIEVHGYRIPTIVYRPSKKDFEDWIALKAMVRKLRKELWVVEWGPWSSFPKDPSDMDLAFIQSRTMAEQINLFGVAAFVHWQAVAPSKTYLPEWPIPQRLGMIRVDFDYKAKFNPIFTKQYYAQLHYSKWIVPGSRLVTVIGVYRFICVAYDPAAQQLVMVITNQRASTGLVKFSKISLNIVNLTPGALWSTMYRTSATEDYQLVFKGPLGPSLEKSDPMKIAPNSINTVVIHNVLVR